MSELPAIDLGIAMSRAGGASLIGGVSQIATRWGIAFAFLTSYFRRRHMAEAV